ncbi:hypothetical protein MIND_00183400 [Mycena indigotica]|uniref:Uncharacterized protein n=1 Tax=Mycena indigotica TaxID=2126181 RepID=A0A8H6T6L5_9AGAR|nr:uncharacterized protein MIND_00183400 [Mycena indigotica]KAF7311734.1 hypothetical protein MIND_00183400 [Mycena indigotica]
MKLFLLSASALLLSAVCASPIPDEAGKHHHPHTTIPICVNPGGPIINKSTVTVPGGVSSGTVQVTQSVPGARRQYAPAPSPSISLCINPGGPIKTA